MINITLHAIERYLDRIDPTVSYPQARSLILDAMSRARRIKERSRMGDAYYVTDELRLIVAEERGNLTVISVLNLHEPEEEKIPPLAMELARQYDTSKLTQKKKNIKREKELIELEKALENAYKKITNIKTKLDLLRKLDT
jgi:hypothetical protein